MKFSILIPVYNVEKYLEQCLDSVMNQNFEDYEVIIVDDGSTDNSSCICDIYAKKYHEKVSVIHKENEGLISARRIAIDNAQGEFCVFVDSDDFVEHNLLETVNNYLSKDDNIDMVIYSFDYYSEGIKKARNRFVANDSEIWDSENKKVLYELLATSDCIDALWIKAIKTDILKRDPIDYKKYYSKNMSEDILQSIYPITYAEKIIYADVPLYNYRYNGDSISRNFSPESIMKKDSSHVFDEIFSVLPLWELDNDEFKNKVYARWFSDVMYIFWKSCENASSKKAIDLILAFNWLSMLPSCSLKTFEGLVNPQYKKLYYYWFYDKFGSIKFMFLKKKIYKSLSSVKKKMKSVLH